MEAALILLLVVLTSGAAWTVGTRAAGGSPGGIRRALVCLTESIGFATMFLLLNLVAGFIIVRAWPILSGDFVTAYVLEDQTLWYLSVLQGFAFRWWLDPGEGDWRGCS